MKKMRFLAVVACVPLLMSALGCPSRGDVQIQNPLGYLATPDGPCAVLEVIWPPRQAVSYDSVWGVVQHPAQRAALAEILSYVAATEGGLPMIDTLEADRTLELAELERTYEPTPEQLDTYIRVLGCASYLSAYIEEWNYTYLLFGSRATARFVISCHVPGNEEPLWSVRVLRKVPGQDERQSAATALRQAFRALNEFRDEPPEP